MTIEQILSKLVVSAIDHFKLDPDEALAAVAQSELANELSAHGNTGNLTIEQLCSRLYDEIAQGK